jgi:hypothetical protein
MELIAMLGALLLLLLTAAEIYVFSPDQLKREFQAKRTSGAIKSTLANFGNPPYGTIMLGMVFLPDQHQELACEQLTRIDWVDEQDPSSSPVLMVDRGTCHFSLKVKHAQNIGARAVIIVNDRDEDIDSVIITDNGAGGNLYIPTFLISQADGELIKSFIREPLYARLVTLNLHFNFPRSVGVVNYEIWLSSGDSRGVEFVQEFSVIGKKLKKDFVFTPRYVMWYCPSCSLTNFNNNELNCLSGGRYCAPDPDLSGPLTGRDVLYEDLREICVFQQTKHNYDDWFDYMVALNSTCSKGISESCSFAAMDKTDVDIKKVKTCVAASFQGDNHAINDNTLLREQRQAWSEINLGFYPAVTINNQTYRGDLEAEAVFIAICSGFDSQPEVCRPSSHTDSAEGNQLSAWTVALLVLLSFGGAVVVMLVYILWMRRKYKAEMRRQLSGAVHQYMALSEAVVLSSSRS